MEVLTWHEKKTEARKSWLVRRYGELLQLAYVGSMDDIHEKPLGNSWRRGWRLRWMRSWAKAGTTTETRSRITIGIAPTPFPFAAYYFAG